MSFGWRQGQQPVLSLSSGAPRSIDNGRAWSGFWRTRLPSALNIRLGCWLSYALPVQARSRFEQRAPMFSSSFSCRVRRVRISTRTAGDLRRLGLLISRCSFRQPPGQGSALIKHPRCHSGHECRLVNLADTIEGSTARRCCAALAESATGGSAEEQACFVGGFAPAPATGARFESAPTVTRGGKTILFMNG